MQILLHVSVLETLKMINSLLDILDGVQITRFNLMCIATCKNSVDFKSLFYLNIQTLVILGLFTWKSAIRLE
jgi:hypothetical protein